MALTISQVIAVSYNAVLAEAKKAANQWAESAFLRELDAQGGIKRVGLGPQIEVPLDYRANPGTAFLSSDLMPLSMSKTEVVTSAVYDVAELSVPIVWSKKDEAQNPTENQKIALVKTLLENALTSHDDAIEQAWFATSTQGFLGLVTHVPTAGTGSDGGIDSTVETWWRSQNSTYVDDTDIENAFTTVYDSAMKGSGSKLMPTLMVSDGATQALFEGTQAANQRYVNSQELKAGFMSLMFKNAKYVFSPYGNTKVYFLNPKNIHMVVSKDAYREKGETQEFEATNAYVTKLYSALQTVTNNRSRLGVAHT